MIVAAMDMTPVHAGSPGVARYVVDLSVALDRIDEIEVVRIGSRPPRGGRLRRALGAVYRHAVFYRFELARRAERRGAGLLHCPDSHVLGDLDLPLVLTIHDMVAWRYPAHLARKEAVAARTSIARTARRASRIIVASEFARREVVELLDVSKERVKVAPWGLDLRFHPVESSAMWRAQRFGIPGKYVLSTGTREPHRNLLAVIAAFERFQLDNPEYTLVVVGDRPPPGSELETAMNQSPARIVRAGFVGDEELVQLYGAAECFAFPSLYEGFGFPPLEAMACGTPVICSDRANLPDLVGDAAAVVDATDPDQLAAMLERVATSSRFAAELRDRGLRRAREFTWGKCARATAAIYREALADPIRS